MRGLKGTKRSARKPENLAVMRGVVIELKQESGKAFARQTLDSPAVLDHWAIRRISTDAQLSERFAAALRRCSGTWALSMISSGEFAGLTFTAHADAADRLLDDVAPNLFFIRAEPFEVIEREVAFAEGRSLEHPAADDELMRTFVELAPDPFVGKGLFRMMVQAAARLRPEMDQLGRGTLEAIARLKLRYDSEPELRRQARAAPHGILGIRSTLALMRVLLRRFLADRGEKPDSNDAIDLLHTVVPVSYCDLVLLDGRWEAAVDEARRALQRAGIDTPVAQVFSERRSGLERFVSALEARVAT